MAKISVKEVLMGRISEADLASTHKQNLFTLIERVNALVSSYAKPIIVSSGYRNPAHNSSLSNASKTSWHQLCAAVDIADADGRFWAFVLHNLDLCAKLGLWVEDKRWTPTWVHLQIYPPASGKRVFVPSTKPALKPELWDGQYNQSLNSKKV